MDINLLLEKIKLELSLSKDKGISLILIAILNNVSDESFDLIMKKFEKKFEKLNSEQLQLCRINILHLNELRYLCKNNKHNYNKVGEFIKSII